MPDDRERNSEPSADRKRSNSSPSPPRRRRSPKVDRERRRDRQDDERSPDRTGRRKMYRSRSRERRSSRSADHVRSGHRGERTATGYSDRGGREEEPRRRIRRRSFSRSPNRRDRDRETSPQALIRSTRPLPSQQDAFAGDDTTISKGTPPPAKEKPNFGTTGRLAAASNTVKLNEKQSIVLKYHEPPEARKTPPKDAWRMYVFKGADITDTVELAEQSCWLFGREAAVADFPIEHPSCSKQHAVIQFRYIEKRNEFGDKKGKVRPYVLDLESSNGTKVNEEQIPAGRFVELRDKDVLTFGHSSREYVVQLPPGR